MNASPTCITVLIGLGATAGIDAWNATLKRVAGVPSLDYCLLGRWIGHMPRGVVRHRKISAAAQTALECPLGWVAHYAIGVGLALVFTGLFPGWLAHPAPGPALAYGVATVVLPFFVLQPALGLGVASAATPRPLTARVKSLVTHGVYGLGLYAWAWAMRLWTA